MPITVTYAIYNSIATHRLQLSDENSILSLLLCSHSAKDLTECIRVILLLLLLSQAGEDVCKLGLARRLDFILRSA